MILAVAGWAAFPPSKPLHSEEEDRPSTFPWDPFGSSMPSSGAHILSKNHSERTAEQGKQDADSREQGQILPSEPETATESKPKTSEKEPASPEFSSFNFWRQPVDDLIED